MFFLLLWCTISFKITQERRKEEEKKTPHLFVRFYSPGPKEELLTMLEVDQQDEKIVRYIMCLFTVVQKGLKTSILPELRVTQEALSLKGGSCVFGNKREKKNIIRLGFYLRKARNSRLINSFLFITAHFIPHSLTFTC